MSKRMNRENVRMTDREAIVSWEDDGGALKYVPPKGVVETTNRLALFALVVVAASGFYLLAKTLTKERRIYER